jgi:hypothetical protein
MVDLLFIAYEQASEAELAYLLAADLDACRSLEHGRHSGLRGARRCRRMPLSHPSRHSFDALLGASA